MAIHSSATDNTHRVYLESAITRVFWSRRRALPGAAIKLHVETKHIPDGTPIDIEIWEDDSGEGSPDDFITEMKGEHTIENNKCVVDYELNWDADSLGDDKELEGRDFEFYFLVKIPDFELERKSGLLFVDVVAYEAAL